MGGVPGRRGVLIQGTLVIMFISFLYITALSQRLDYLKISNPDNAQTSLQALDADKLLLSQARQNNLYYDVHYLNSALVPVNSGRLTFRIPISNMTGIIRMHSLTDGSLAIMGRRPGGETFISRWSGSNSPLWTYRLKSGDSPDFPRRNLFDYGMDTLVVVDIIYVSSTIRRLLITVIDKDGVLLYSHSIFRDNIDWQKMDAYCNGTNIWICGQPKTDTSVIFSWSIAREEITRQIDIPGYSVESIQILDNGNLLIGGIRLDDKRPFAAVLDPVNLETLHAITIRTHYAFIAPEVHLAYDKQSVYMDIHSAGDSLRRVIRMDLNLQLLSSLSIKTMVPSRSLVIGDRYFTLANYNSGLEPILCCYTPDATDGQCETQNFCFEMVPVPLKLYPGKAFSLFSGSILRRLSLELSNAPKISLTDTCIGIKEVPFPDFDIDRDTFCLGACVEMHPLGNNTAESWEWKVSGASDSIWSREKDPECLSFNRGGRYTITQTIRFEGCIYEATKQVFISDAFIHYDIPDIYLCPGADTIIRLPSGLSEIHWEDGSQARTRHFDRAGNFSIEAVNEADCPVRDSFEVYEIHSPDITIIPGDTLICEEDALTLRAFPYEEGTVYHWSTGASDDSISIQEEGIYSVTATNVCGTDTASAQISVKACKVRVYIPNIFSPNKDGINDSFEVFLHNAEFVSLVIFDRWGNLVYSSSENSEPWMGAHGNILYPAGVYVYKLLYRDVFTGSIITRSGDITLIR